MTRNNGFKLKGG